MNTNTMVSESPVIIGGVGGSGTRVVAQLCKSIGIDIGDSLSVALDQLWFTLLFRRTKWRNQKPSQGEITEACMILHAAYRLDKSIMQRSDVTQLLTEIASDATNIGLLNSRFNNWHEVADDMISCKQNNSKNNLWGWKEPNSHLFLSNLVIQFPDLKYIHIIRNGLEMAYSKNQNQLSQWGQWFTPNAESLPPKRSFDFWSKANAAAKSACETSLNGQYLWISYDDICSHPHIFLDQFSAFLDIQIDPRVFNSFTKNIKTPISKITKQTDLSIFDASDFEKLKYFGYTSNQR